MRAYSWLRIMALAEPKCKTQSGLGENRVTILVYLSALGSGGSFFSSAFSFFWVSGHFSSTIVFCVAQERLLTSFTIVLITFESSFILDLRSCLSPRILPTIAPV